MMYAAHQTQNLMNNMIKTMKKCVSQNHQEK